MIKNIRRKTNEQGFTLIEILVVIGIIAVLAAIVLVAINPALRFAQAQNSQRNGNVTAILDAVGQYMVDNQGDVGDLDFPGALDGTLAEVDADFCGDIVPSYLAVMPTDPDSTTGGGAIDCGDIGAGDVEYEVGYDEDTGRLAVCAPLAADESAIADAEEICVYR